MLNSSIKLINSDYMYETIRPSEICKALLYLRNTPLYKKYNIIVDEKFLETYETNPSEKINFIINSSDNEAESISVAGQPIDNGNIYQEVIEDDGEEVLIVDRNKESPLINVEVIAPGQDKYPVPWHIQPDIEELSFPKIYGGFPMDLKGNLSYADRVKSEARRLDRRSCNPTKLLYMAKKKLELSCISNN